MSRFRIELVIGSGMAIACLFCSPAWGLAQDTVVEANPTQSPSAQVSGETKVDQQQAIHDKLAKYLSGTKWTGQFTMAGNPEPRTEHYEIISAEKGEIGDYWNLIARIKYGKHDKTFPLPPIEIKFAGGTPVITVDNIFFPGFGNFDARVLIRKGQYAGTWAHVGDGGGVGGHMFGTIEKMDAEELKKKGADFGPGKADGNSTDSGPDHR